MQNEERINVLETQVRTLKEMVDALMAQVSPDVIQSKKFEVVNGEGKVIVELSNLIGGGADNGMLVTRTSAGKTLVELGATNDGEGKVVTRNSQGQTLVELTANSDGKGMVTTENGNGKTLVIIGTNSNGGAVQTQNGRGKVTSTTS